MSFFPVWNALCLSSYMDYPRCYHSLILTFSEVFVEKLRCYFTAHKMWRQVDIVLPMTFTVRLKVFAMLLYFLQEMGYSYGSASENLEHRYVTYVGRDNARHSRCTRNDIFSHRDFRLSFRVNPVEFDRSPSFFLFFFSGRQTWVRLLFERKVKIII